MGPCHTPDTPDTPDIGEGGGNTPPFKGLNSKAHLPQVAGKTPLYTSRAPLPAPKSDRVSCVPRLVAVAVFVQQQKPKKREIEKEKE